MGLMTSGRCAGTALSWRGRDLTMAELLADSIVQTLMKADGVDPQALQTELRNVARQIESWRRQERGD